MTHVLVLGKDGCNPCNRVKRILREMRADGLAFDVEEVDMGSERGTSLAIRHNVIYPPAVFVDGRLLCWGKVRESELQTALRSGTR